MSKNSLSVWPSHFEFKVLELKKEKENTEQKLKQLTEIIENQNIVVLSNSKSYAKD